MRSKQHSFIAQLSARVQEVYYFASLLSLCTGVSYKLTEQLMWKTMNTYTVIINTKTDRKSKEIKHGAVKKEVFFCFVLNSKSHWRTRTHTLAHKPVNLKVWGESLLNITKLVFFNQLNQFDYWLSINSVRFIISREEHLL